MLDKLKKLLQKIFNFDLEKIEEQILAFICGGEALPQPLSNEEEKELLEKNDDESKAILIERNLRLVVYIAKKFESTGIDVDDLISVGAVGLIKAVQSFNNEKNIKLATYASRCIENEILMYLRKVTKQKLEVSLDEPLSYDKEGNEVSQIEYEKQCLAHYCEILSDGTYYGKNGNIVTEEVYKSECEALIIPHYCEVINGTYYDVNGNVVSKEQYEISCHPEIENPQTGVAGISLFFVVLGLATGILGYAYTKKNNKIYHI